MAIVTYFHKLDGLKQQIASHSFRGQKNLKSRCEQGCASSESLSQLLVLLGLQQLNSKLSSCGFPLCVSLSLNSPHPFSDKDTSHWMWAAH
jgi:hypothetical protein